MVGQRRTNLVPDGWVGDVLWSPSDLERGDSTQIDGANLVAEDDRVPGLTGMIPGDRDVTWVLGRSGGDGANRGHAGTMERLI